MRRCNELNQKILKYFEHYQSELIQNRVGEDGPGDDQVEEGAGQGIAGGVLLIYLKLVGFVSSRETEVGMHEKFTKMVSLGVGSLRNAPLSCGSE